MTVQSYFKVTRGTPVIWGQPSAAVGTVVTKNMTLNNLATAAGRMGVFADLGEPAYEEYDLELIWEVGTAPTAGLTVELYMAASSNSSLLPGTVDGTDAAYTVANRFQIGAPAIVHYCLGSTNTAQRSGPVIYRPAGRYVAPVLVNLSGQSSRNNGTATDSACRIILTPRRADAEDAA